MISLLSNRTENCCEGTHSQTAGKGQTASDMCLLQEMGGDLDFVGRDLEVCRGAAFLAPDSCSEYQMSLFNPGRQLAVFQLPK